MTAGTGEPASPPRAPLAPRLSGVEQRSVTHGEFWIPQAERDVYARALGALNAAGLRYVVSGLYAIYEYTGIYRDTKDLDLFVEPGDVIRAAGILKDADFRVRLAEPHWLAKAMDGDCQVDFIFGMGNGLALIDRSWWDHSRAGILAGVPVRVAPPEELLWHRLFVHERHRSDMADVLHLMLCRGDELRWDRILQRLQDHWRLLLVQVHLFDFVYPGHRTRIPRRVREELYARAADEIDEPGDPDICQGTLFSRFSFAIDVNEWGFQDYRTAAVSATCELPVIQEIENSSVWDDRGHAEDEKD